MNIFLGLPVPAEIGKILKERLLANNPHWRHHSAINWIAMNNFHLTLHFFGPAEPESLSLLTAELTQEIQTVRSFLVKVNKLDSFPRSQSKLIAAYIQLDNPLVDLYNLIQRVVQKHKLSREKRVFFPHITLCRAHRDSLLFMEPILLEDFNIKMTSLILYQSKSGISGSEYTPLHEWLLI